MPAACGNFIFVSDLSKNERVALGVRGYFQKKKERQVRIHSTHVQYGWRRKRPTIEPEQPPPAKQNLPQTKIETITTTSSQASAAQPLDAHRKSRILPHPNASRRPLRVNAVNAERQISAARIVEIRDESPLEFEYNAPLRSLPNAYHADLPSKATQVSYIDSDGWFEVDDSSPKSSYSQEVAQRPAVVEELEEDYDGEDDTSHKPSVPTEETKISDFNEFESTTLDNLAQKRFLGWLNLWSARQTSIDPFAMFSVALDRAGNSGVHAYAATYPEILWRLKPDAPFNPHRDAYLPVAVRHPASLYQLVAYVSAYSDKLSGRKESPTSIRYQNAAFRAIRKSLENSSRKAKLNVLLFLMGALGAEVVKHGEPTPSCRAHSLIISQLIRHIGGPSALRDDPQLDWITVWVRTLCDKSRLNLWESGAPPGLEAAFRLEVLEFRASCARFVFILHAFTDWAASIRLSYSLSPRCSRLLDAKRTATFGRGAFLRALLNCPNSEIPGTELFVVNADSHLLHGGPQLRDHEATPSCLFCRFWLTHALWEYRATPALMDTLIDALNIRVADEGIGDLYTSTPLFWLLVRGVDAHSAVERERAVERKWLAESMVHVMWRLGERSKGRVMALMMGLLDPESRDEVVFEEGEVERIGREVLEGIPEV